MIDISCLVNLNFYKEIYLRYENELSININRTRSQQKSTHSNKAYRRFNAIVSQLKMHYFSGGAFESLISSQLLKKEKYI